MFKLFVIGIDEPVLSARQESLLATCTLIVGTRRFALMTAGFRAAFQTVTPLDEAFAAISRHLAQGNVAVLASGDPLFYGIGRRLLAEFPEEAIEVHPALSSVQRACALFRLPWDDAAVVSLHGRPCTHLPGLLLGPGKHIVLTDACHSPDRIAGKLLDYLHSVGEKNLPRDVRMLVVENIGLPNERVFRGTLAEGAAKQFSELNTLCLIVPEALGLPDTAFGLGEDELFHSRGLITKNEVRAATLHALRLPPVGIFWDIGAGSGSLSVEAARQNPRLTVFAIERKDEELQNILKNISKFRCFNVVPVPGSAPDALERLPAPDRVFIGGSGGSLPAIIDHAAGRLAEGGLLVVNGVLDKTVREAPQAMKKLGFTVTTAVVAVTRTGADGEERQFNPITIISGRR